MTKIIYTKAPPFKEPLSTPEGLFTAEVVGFLQNNLLILEDGLRSLTNQPIHRTHHAFFLKMIPCGTCLMVSQYLSSTTFDVWMEVSSKLVAPTDCTAVAAWAAELTETARIMMAFERVIQGHGFTRSWA